MVKASYERRGFVTLSHYSRKGLGKLHAAAYRALQRRLQGCSIGIFDRARRLRGADRNFETIVFLVTDFIPYSPSGPKRSVVNASW
jgi:hypothetical protein